MKVNSSQSNQPRSFFSVIYVILRMKIDLSASFRILIGSEYQRIRFLLIINRRKAACTRCRCKRTTFHYKCELNVLSYCKHFDQIHLNIS